MGENEREKLYMVRKRNPRGLRMMKSEERPVVLYDQVRTRDRGERGKWSDTMGLTVCVCSLISTGDRMTRSILKSNSFQAQR